jgi:tripeptide aminopeptidase
MRVELLKNLLAVPSPSYQEKAMVEFIVRHVEQMGPRSGVHCRVDERNNVYITKGDAEFLPCVAAHIDTVLRSPPACIVQHGGLLVGFDEAGRRTGIGGDDKAGVYICLELLERFDSIAVALFAAEEVGCVGSRNADPEFFERVGYVVEFDCPGRGLVSYTSGGVRLFQNDGDFITAALPVMCRHGALNWQHHPFSDVKAIGGRFGLCCLNVSAGYYNWHRHDEFVKLADVEHALAFGTDLIRALGNRRYDLDSSQPDLADPAVQVTGLDLDTLMNPLDWSWKTSTPFDPTNPDPWLESLIRHTSALPEAGQRASVIVLRSVLEEDAYVRTSPTIPDDAAPGEWLPWHVERGRVDAAELGTPGVLLVHEALAGAAEDEAFVVAALQARAWRDTGYDPAGWFARTVK